MRFSLKYILIMMPSILNYVLAYSCYGSDIVTVTITHCLACSRASAFRFDLWTMGYGSLDLNLIKLQ